MTFPYIPWLVTCIQCVPGSVFCKQTRPLMAASSIICLLLVSSIHIIEMFSIRLSEAKENRNKFILTLSLRSATTAKMAFSSSERRATSRGRRVKYAQ